MSRNTNTVTVSPASIAASVASVDVDAESNAQLVAGDAQSVTDKSSDAEQSVTPATPAGDSSDALTLLLAGMTAEQRALIETLRVAPATPATPARKMTRSDMKRLVSLRLVSLIAANLDTLTAFDDASLSVAADAFLANYMSYAPAIQQLVSHTCTFAEIVDAAQSLS
jgi:hypothetical protein